MTARPTTTITTRRALLAGAIGAAAASVAGSLTNPTQTRATDGGSILLGRSPSGTIDGTGVNEATTTTRIKTAGNDGFSVETGDAAYSAIFGLNSATTSNGRGVHGRSDGSTGIGVWGHAAHTTGTTKGVYGSSSSSVGVGVYGVAPNTTGPTKGVYGSSSSSAGIGVHGVASNTAGSGVGVVGESAGSVGQGVRAVSTTPTGYAYALYARSMSDQGAAVLAQSQANSGVCYGVFGQVQSPNGTGVVGHAGAATGATHGVLGRSFSPDGFGTIGHSVADGTGVLGLTGPLSSMLPAPVAKTAVYGRATQDSGSRGVYGYSTAGQGVRGQATTGTAGHFSTPQSDGIHRGTALRAVGRVRFDRCAGLATIVSGANSVTVAPGIDLVSTSAVVATLQGSAGSVTTVHRVSVNASANTFTILLTANSTADVKVAWHVFG